jgi:signal peptidase I
MKNFVDSTRDFITEWALNILILLFGTTTLVQAFIVPTPSMDKTVMVGDHLLVDKLSYAPSDSFSKHLLPYTEPKRGDVIVFRYPMDISQNYVKRCMGLPGDHLKVVDKELWLNGHKLVEPYVQHVFPRIEPYRDNFPSEPYGPVYDRARKMLSDNVINGEVVVPEGFYFAMGDNRDNSLDSRYWGFVPRENIIGKPLVIFW